MSQNVVKTEHTSDVVICGAGLAGLTLARQLKQTLPQCSIILIDSLSRPLPEAAFKVGESMTEAGGHYLAEKLKLTDYFEQHHVLKLGLRFFFSNDADAFHDRPELGLSRFPKVDSYQVDRGVLEADLRQFNVDAGIELLEGVSVKDIILGENEKAHEVILDGNNSPKFQQIKARWVVDAMGRRRFLQKKLGLTQDGRRKKYSSAWFRFKERVDVSDLVPRDQADWHERVPDGRYNSTNHLMGAGYWVWIIPLVSDYTSIGIVAHEDIHPYAGFKTFPLAMQWLKTHEPALAAHLADREPLDFKGMRRYSYSSKQAFSDRRWACVGEAAVFSDPFYSVGTEMIGFSNTMTTEMIRLDFEGKLTPDRVLSYNQFLLSYNDALTDNIQVAYPFFGNPVVMTAKVIWDTTAAWSFTGAQLFNSIYLCPEKSAQIRQVTSHFFFLTRRIQQLFTEWAEKSPGRLSFDFIDYFFNIDLLSKLRVRNLQAGKNLPELIENQQTNMARIEELAQVLFLLAVEDVMPERLAHFPEPIWLNAWRVSLQPERWEADGLLQPKSQPRDCSTMREQIRSLFSVKEKEIPTASGS